VTTKSKAKKHTTELGEGQSRGLSKNTLPSRGIMKTGKNFWWVGQISWENTKNVWGDRGEEQKHLGLGGENGVTERGNSVQKSPQKEVARPLEGA